MPFILVSIGNFCHHFSNICSSVVHEIIYAKWPRCGPFCACSIPPSPTRRKTILHPCPYLSFLYCIAEERYSNFFVKNVCRKPELSVKILQEQRTWCGGAETKTRRRGSPASESETGGTCMFFITLSFIYCGRNITNECLENLTFGSISRYLISFLVL